MIIKLSEKRNDEEWLKSKIRQDFDNAMDSSKGVVYQISVYTDCLERCQNWSFDDLAREIKSDYEFVISKRQII